MQKNLFPVAWLTTLTLIAAICADPIAAQGPPNYSGPARYGPDYYGDTQTMPRPPTRPMQPSRPASWPGGPGQNRPRGPSQQQQPPPQQHPPTELKLCEGTLILAKIGSEVILACELVGEIDVTVSRGRGKLSPEKIEAQRRQLIGELKKGIAELSVRGSGTQPRSQADLEREVLIRQLLNQQIETKLIYHDARQKIPKEGFPQIEKNLTKKFDDKVLDQLLKQYQVVSRRELDEKLHQMGSSIGKRRRSFIQKTLARGWVREQIEFNEEITYDQMLEYYQGNLAEFETSARVKWEELMTRFSQHASKDEAHAAIAWMGNRVQAGVPLAQIAEQHSNGATASSGGRRDWIDKGSLVSEELDAALFGLPEGQLSRILTSKSGYHIVRVVQREDDARTSFLEAQVAIKEKIRNRRIQQQLRAYVFRLQEQVPVWTIFDDRTSEQGTARRQDPPRR